MDETTFKDKSVLEELKKFVAAKINIDNAKSIAFEFKVKSVPWITVIDPRNRERISEFVGFADVPSMKKFLDDSLKKYQAATNKQEEGIKLLYKRTGLSLELDNKNIVIDMWNYHLFQAIDFADSGFDGDTMRMRQSRFGLQATMLKNFTLFTHVDFALDKPLLDLYAEYQVTRPINIRVGRFKVPMGTQFLPRRDFWDFVEPTGFALGLLPRRDIGAMLSGGGGLYGIYMKYAVGLFNGVQDGYSDVDNAKDFAARLTLNPFPSPDFDLNASIAWTRGNTSESLGSFKLTDESITSLLKFPAAAQYDGSRKRRSIELELLWKNFVLGAEEIFQSSDITSGTITEKRYEMKTISAWAACILTGEKKSRDEWLVPKGGLGAFEIACRYSKLDLDNDLAAIATANVFTDKATQHTIGINWYQTQYTRMMLNYQWSSYDDKIQSSPGVLKDKHKVFLAGFEVRF